MIGTNSTIGELSLVEKAREFLEFGDVTSAVACYGKVFDPDSLDEEEARSMLIEGRSNLSRKYLHEALDCFEEALLMGTDVQRRQALDGITEIGKIRAKMKGWTETLKSGLQKYFGQEMMSTGGPALISDSENVALITAETVEALPKHLARSSRIYGLPPHLKDARLPISANKCIPYTTEADVQLILEIAEYLASHPLRTGEATEPDSAPAP